MKSPAGAEITPDFPDAVTQPALLTVTQASRRSGIPVATISHWINRGLLPVGKLTGRRRVRCHIRLTDLLTTQTHVLVSRVLPAWRRETRRAGRRLRSLREAAALNQSQLAAACHVAHDSISRFETGERVPQPETLRALAGALGVDPDRLVSTDPIGLSAMTMAEAGSRLGVSPERVQKWLRQGTLPGLKVSGQWRVLAIVIDELDRSDRLRGPTRRFHWRYPG